MVILFKDFLIKAKHGNCFHYPTGETVGVCRSDLLLLSFALCALKLPVPFIGSREKGFPESRENRFILKMMPFVSGLSG